MARIIVAAAAICLIPASLWADDTKPSDIEFHTAAISFPCRDKTPKEFASVNPDRKIVEASIRLSATFNIVESEVDRIEYKLRMPPSFEITDYLPKIKLESETVGQIAVSRQDSTRSLTVVSLDSGAKAGFQVPGVGDFGMTTNARSNDEGAKEITSNVQLNLLAPKQLITSASTQDAGQTLHFKLKQFTQTTLEGDKDFAFLAAVPKDWKGDCFPLECTAFKKNTRSYSHRKTVLIALYMSGDLDSKKQVEAIAKKHKPLVSTALDPTPSGKPLSKISSESSKYIGNYTFNVNGGLQTWSIDLHADGTFAGSIVALLNTAKLKGTWFVKDNKFVVSGTQETIAGTLCDITVFDDYIELFDEATKTIKLRSGYILKHKNIEPPASF